MQYNYNIENNINTIDTGSEPQYTQRVSLDKSPVTTTTTTTTATTTSYNYTEASSSTYNPQLEVINNERSETGEITIRLKKGKGISFNETYPNQLIGWITQDRYQQFIREINLFLVRTDPKFTKNLIFLILVAIALIIAGAVYIGRGRTTYSSYILLGVGCFDALLLIAYVAVKVYGDQQIIKHTYKNHEDNYSVGGIQLKIKNKKTLLSQFCLIDGYCSRDEAIKIIIQVPSQLNLPQETSVNLEKFQIN